MNSLSYRPAHAGRPGDIGSDAVVGAKWLPLDPRYPARKAASEALNNYVNKWFDDYELDDGESQPHAPSEFELLLIMDAFHRLVGDGEYMRLDAAWRCAALQDSA